MGEGFRSKTRKAYKHFIQTQLPSLEGGTLFALPESQDIRYPCKIDEGIQNVEIGARATLVARNERTRIDLVRGVQVIGCVEGEAVVSLRRRFKAKNAWPAVLGVAVVTVLPAHRFCEVSPA